MISGEIKTLDIISFLQENGYQVNKASNYISFPAIWRNGNNLTAVTGYPDKDLYIDWVTSDKFNHKGLIQRVLGLKTENDSDGYLQKNNYSAPVKLDINLKQEFKMNEIFDKELLVNLIQDYSYWESRGISAATVKQFGGGIANLGKMKNRWVFPIFNSKKDLIGATGRTLVNSNIKWKILGTKNNFVFPAHLNGKLIQDSKKVILVESIGDLISLFECGIKNVICLFGIELQLGVLNYLLKINPEKIIIATNNDVNFAGNAASIKIQNKIRKYFDYNTPEIRLPLKNDINEMLTLGMKDDIVKLYGN